MKRLSSCLVLAAAAALLAASPGEAAALFATPVNGGDRAFGTIDSTSDRDLFEIQVPDGARLAVSVKASARSTLLPLVEVFGPDGASVDLKKVLVGENSPWVRFDTLGIHESGTYTVGVSGFGGSTGAYEATVAGLVEKKIQSALQVAAGETTSLPFTGVTGAKVAYAIRETGGAGLEAAFVCCPRGNPIPDTEAAHKGLRLSARGIVLDRGPGRYGLVLHGSDAGATSVDVKAVVKMPAVKKRKIRLGDEPRPSAMSPWNGRDGVPFTVTGSGFAEGARVVFGDAAEATDVEVVSPAEIRGKAPRCDASDLGEKVAVSVVNTDGQFGPLPQTFGFLGLPAAKAAVPKFSPLEGGVLVTVHGTGFRAGFSVEVGGAPASSVAVATPTQITFLAPAHGAGEVDIVVFDEFGRPGAAVPGFWYADTPVVAGATPDALPSFGGVTVTLSGGNFTPLDRVFVGGVEAADVAAASLQSLSFTCPGSESGGVVVEVRDPAGRSWSGEVLTMTPSLQDVSATALPAAPWTGDFNGTTLAAGDLTGDALPEILVARVQPEVDANSKQLKPALWVLENDGTGAFGISPGTPSFSEWLDMGQASAASIGDLDGDGYGDAAISRAVPLQAKGLSVNYYGYTAYYDINYPESMDNPLQTATRLLRNDGRGGLSDETRKLVAPTGSTPALGQGDRWQGAAQALGDLDGDGDADLLVTAPDAVHFGTVDGVQWTYIKVRYYYYYYRYYKDKALLRQSSSPASATRVMENGGDGSLAPSRAGNPEILVDGDGGVLEDFRGVASAVGDLDGDGDLDAIVLKSTPSFAEDGGGGIVQASALRILANDGSGCLSFTPSAVPAPQGSSDASGEFWQGNALAMGDLDGDGDLDLAVGRAQVSYWTDAGGSKRLLPALRLFRNDGSGTFSEDTGGFLPADLFEEGSARTLLGATGLLVADLDRDGDRDIVVTGKVTTVANAGGGKGPNGILPAGTRVATRVLLNDGSGAFDDATSGWLPPGDLFPSERACVADLDGDGDPDLILASETAVVPGTRPLRVLKNR